jgi:peptidoglycan/LPS O-acetylase OafA/YrhL
LFRFRPRSDLPGGNMIAAALIVVGLYISWMTQRGENYVIPLWIAQNANWALPAQSVFSIQKCIAGFMIFLAVLVSPAIQSGLSTSFFRFLGRVSFPLYLVHWPALAFVGFGFGLYGLVDCPIWLKHLVNVSVWLVLLSGVTALFVWIDRKSIAVAKEAASRLSVGGAHASEPKLATAGASTM